MKRNKYLLVAVALIVLSVGAIIAFRLINENQEIMTDNDFYNESLILSANVFLRVNTLPLKDTIEEVETIETKIDDFHKAYLEMKGSPETKTGANLMDQLFINSYEAIELSKQFINEENGVTHNMLWEKITEAQNTYIEFSKHLDESSIPIYSTTISAMQTVTFDVINETN